MSLTVLNVHNNQLSGFLTPILSGLIVATEFGVLFAQALCQRFFQLRLRFLIWRAATLVVAEVLTSLLVEFRLTGAL